MKSASFWKFTLLFACCAFFTLELGDGCKTNTKDDGKGRTAMPLRDINEVKEAHTKDLMSLQGVVGVYVGQLEDGTPCIGVMVVKKTAELEKKIPKTLEGHPVKIDETGEIKPMK